MRFISSGPTFVTCIVIDQLKGEKQLGKHIKYTEGVGSFSARFLDRSPVIWQLADTPAAGAICWALLNKLCLVQMLHLSASSGICSQETHIHGFILWIPFMSQGYKDSLPWRKPKGLAWKKSWPGSKDVTQAVRRSRGSSSGLCAVEMVEGEILQLKAILSSLNQKQNYELWSAVPAAMKAVAVVQDTFLPWLLWAVVKGQNPVASFGSPGFTMVLQNPLAALIRVSI